MPHAPLSPSSATRCWTFTPSEGPIACAFVRLGVFGGTFDPPHVGHLVTAVNVRHALALDRVLLVVANVPWQKVGERTVSPAEDRLAMVEAAARGVAGLEVSRLEIDRGGPSYTADTLGELRRAHPRAELFLIVGSDAAGAPSSSSTAPAPRVSSHHQGGGGSV